MPAIPAVMDMQIRVGYFGAAFGCRGCCPGEPMQTLTRWWPVTYDFGLIRSDLDTVAAMRAKQYQDANLQVATTCLSGSLEESFATLEPLSPASTKELFIATTFGWTAFFANGARGSDPFLPMLQLSKALGATALRACESPAGARYPGVILEVYDTPQAGGSEDGYRRSIAAANDGGRWVFHQSGAPFAFEDLARYEARKKRDRFTGDMLWSYLENLGIPRLTDEMLQPGGTCRGVLLARPTHAHLPQYTLEEARAL